MFSVIISQCLLATRLHQSSHEHTPLSSQPRLHQNVFLLKTSFEISAMMRRVCIVIFDAFTGCPNDLPTWDYLEVPRVESSHFFVEHFTQSVLFVAFIKTDKMRIYLLQPQKATADLAVISMRLRWQRATTATLVNVLLGIWVVEYILSNIYFIF